MVKKPSFFSRLFSAGLIQDAPIALHSMVPLLPMQLAEDVAVENEGVPQRVVIHRVPVGTSGVQNFAGYPAEEYLADLSGVRAAILYDKMRRSEPKVKMVLSAVKNIIKAATWEIDAADLGEENIEVAERHAEFIKHVLFNDMDKSWRSLLNEILTMIDFGFSIFEVTHKNVLGHPRFGDYTGIRSIAFRAQKTINRFNLDKDTGKLLSVTQIAFGDLNRFVDISSDYLLTFTIEKEGDNYEGISMLRACYGPWLRKQTYLKLMAIGIEKFAIPTPVGEIPSSKENTLQENSFRTALRTWTSHESNYIIIPEGWKINFTKNDFDAQKIQVAIDAESKEIADSFLAGFLALNDRGSYARSYNESDFFLNSIEYIAHLVAETISLDLIPKIIDLNYGIQTAYPQLKYSGISDRGGKELADALKSLCDSKAIIPDDDLEEHIRKRFDFPKKGETGQRYGGQIDAGVPKTSPDAAGLPDAATVAPKQAGTPASLLHSERRIRLAEKRAKQQIETSKALLKKTMQDGLTTVSQELIKQLMSKVRRLPASQQLDAIKNLKLSGMQDYKASLRQTLSSIAQAALDQARKEVPKAKKVRLSEETGLRLSEFDNLPPAVKKKVQAQADLLSDTHQGDLEKAVYFQFTHSVDSTDSDSLLESDLEQAAADFVDGPSIEAGSGNVASATVNSTRSAFFFDDEVLQEIESFTFVNGDPVSPICQDLAGTTFAKDDPEAQRYFPPLHHNCKSYIVPNLVGGTSRDIEPLKPSSPSLDKYVTLAEISLKS